MLRCSHFGLLQRISRSLLFRHPRGNDDLVQKGLNSTDVTSRATAFETGFLSLPLDGLLTQAGEVYFKVRVGT